MRISFYVYMSLRGFQFPNLQLAEIGVYKGDNAEVLLKTTTNIKELVLVDNFRPYEHWFTDAAGTQFNEVEADMFYECVKKRFLSYGEKINLIRKTSQEAAKDFPDEYFDYIYIDGGHSYPQVKSDIESWYPKVKPYGMIAGHDILYHEVAQAVNEFANCNKILTFGTNIISFAPVPQDFNDLHDWWIFKLPKLDT